MPGGCRARRSLFALALALTLFVGFGAIGQPVRTAPDGGAAPTGGAAAKFPADLLRQVQGRLQQQGLYVGNIDGVLGPRTRAALVHFQTKEGLAATGVPDEATVARLFPKTETVPSGTKEGIATPDTATIVIVVSGVVGVVGLAALVGRIRRRTARVGRAQDIGADLKGMLERLAMRAWSAREDLSCVPLVLPFASSSRLEPGDFVAALHDHVRQVAPDLAVPWATPRVEVVAATDAAGQFVVADGSVRIVVGPDFWQDASVARAIICHEFCHYVLDANGIRERTPADNERLADVAMFVFGLGEVFLAGYGRGGGLDYRPGHRLGQLSDAEYRFVGDRVTALRRSGELM